MQKAALESRLSRDKLQSRCRLDHWGLSMTASAPGNIAMKVSRGIGHVTRLFRLRMNSHPEVFVELLLAIRPRRATLSFVVLLNGSRRHALLFVKLISMLC